MSHFTRRSFLKAAAVAGGSYLVTGTKASGNVLRANDRVRIAVAGLNGRGKNHLGRWMEQDNVEIAYVIDPDEDIRGRTHR